MSTREMFIDKSSWTATKFGDVAIQQKVNVNREDTTLTKYVKGEHMSSEDIHLRSWGELQDEYLGPAFIRYFEEGDILYGSRRTYLKKVSIAPFEGITSNTTFVIKANEEKIDKRLLPFLMLSDGFTEHSIMHSKGSVNPYINWRDLAKYEFLLPPKDQQAELAELLWNLNIQGEHALKTVKKLEQFLNSKIEDEIHGISLKGKSINAILQEFSNYGDLIRLDSCGELLKGKSIPKSAVINAGIPCIRYGELYTKHHRVIKTFYSFIDEEEASKSIQLKTNDVLFAGSGETIKEIGKSAAFVSSQRTYAGSDILIFRPKKMDGTYLGYLMNSFLVRHQLNKLGSGATVMHIYNSDLAKVLIPKISLSRQIEIGEKLQIISRSIDTARAQAIKGKLLEKSIINQIF